MSHGRGLKVAAGLWPLTPQSHFLWLGEPGRVPIIFLHQSSSIHHTHRHPPTALCLMHSLITADAPFVQVLAECFVLGSGKWCERSHEDANVLMDLFIFDYVPTLILVSVMVVQKKKKKKETSVQPLYGCCLYSPPDYTNHYLNKSLPNVN